MKEYFWKKHRIHKTEALSILNTKTKFWKPFLLMLPTLLAILLMLIIPVILVIVQAFQTVKLGGKASDITFSLNNFFGNKYGSTGIFYDPKFTKSIGNSVLYALIALPISLGISLIISSAIAHVVKRWARSFWQTVFFLPYVTSAVAVSLTFSYIFGKTTEGAVFPLLYGHKWGVPLIVIIIRGVWGNLAFQILILTTAMLSVNQDLYKSASIDGASSTKQFFKITLPSIKGTLSFLFTIGIIGGIKVFPLALYNNRPDDAILNNGGSIILYIFYMTKTSEYGRAGAASIILFILGFTISFGLRKIISIIYKSSIKRGEKNVAKKIENQTLKRTVTFKI